MVAAKANTVLDLQDVYSTTLHEMDNFDWALIYREAANEKIVFVVTSSNFKLGKIFDPFPHF